MKIIILNYHIILAVFCIFTHKVHSYAFAVQQLSNNQKFAYSVQSGANGQNTGAYQNLLVASKPVNEQEAQQLQQQQHIIPNQHQDAHQYFAALQQFYAASRQQQQQPSGNLQSYPISASQNNLYPQNYYQSGNADLQQQNPYVVNNAALQNPQSPYSQQNFHHSSSPYTAAAAPAPAHSPYLSSFQNSIQNPYSANIQAASAPQLQANISPQMQPSQSPLGSLYSAASDVSHFKYTGNGVSYSF